MRRFIRMAAIATLVAGPVLVAVPTSAATGTWTKITSPKGPGQPIYQYFNSVTTPNPTMNISGITSMDVVNVNFYCFVNLDQVTSAAPLNSAPVPVSSGTFSATGVPTPNASTGCTLRAVPDSYTQIDASGNNTGYVGAFAGPTFYTGLRTTTANTGTNVVSLASLTAHQRALDYVTTPDFVGILLAVPNDDFSKYENQNVAQVANLALFPANLVPSGSSTKSEVVIDGHNAYLPLTLSGYAADQTTVPHITFSAQRLADGNTSIAETDPLRWCSGAYPPATASCTPLATGVALQRTVVTSAQGALLTVHDRFVSIDHAAHSLSVEYFNILSGANSGEAGMRLPGASSFTVPTPNTTKTNLPVGPHTILTTSDLHATDGDPNRADGGLTYSGKPTLYVATTSTFGLRYSRAVPKNGAAGFGFAIETGFTVNAVNALANGAQRALTPHLAITAPHNGATVSSATTTVKGKVTNAVNGLPTTVTVASGTKSKTVPVKADGTFSAGLALAAGKHTITVKGTDPAGGKLSATTKITHT